MPYTCFYNGRYMDADAVCLSVYDLGLLRGYAVFDFMRTYRGVPFHLADHLRRLRSSAAALLLDFKYSDEEITEVLRYLIKESELQDAGIRFIITGGIAYDSLTIGEPNFIILIDKLPAYNEEFYTRGVSLMTEQHRRQEPESKTTSYVTAIKLQKKCRENGCFDVLYTADKEILELTRNNFFLIKNGVLITAESNILKGVTRKVILEIAGQVMPIEERKVLLSELSTTDEAFLSGTSKGIIPVVKVDERLIGDGKPGPYTRHLMQLFSDYIRDWTSGRLK